MLNDKKNEIPKMPKKPFQTTCVLVQYGIESRSIGQNFEQNQDLGQQASGKK